MAGGEEEEGGGEAATKTEKLCKGDGWEWVVPFKWGKELGLRDRHIKLRQGT